MNGKLFLCGTPIGNLEDITFRALETIRNCDVVYAEDTRHSLKLLNHFEISKPLRSYHEHNQSIAGPEIINKLKQGEQIVLVTDAGMPGISDPGEALVKLCIEHEVPFEVVPGVTAFSMALVGSGLSTERFVFEGFLSRDKKQKKVVLERIKKDTRTLIFYESPHRFKETIKVIFDIFGDRNAVVARELTKRYEEFNRAKLSDLITYYETHDIRGEIVLIIEGYVETEEDLQTYDKSETIKSHVLRYMDSGVDKKDAMKRVAVERGIKKTEVYAALIE
ncbi:16S rRNA (cytidine(1402)-2'-O)-methyltransferase [Fusibacter bizertensis]|jgi:probable S-adenosylmethionine-dependent methyltransferase, YraL family|uniref:Ribosomal RNA small subunit methyltransferase I n=1 Tax=Fusibacter bizertensis TaxID=1488331 RepID=A0ABT6NDI4_9FIRM|nr:16S rRNA (cytidine(1402)-2'-O)-methyltransferase [Fusibacter bizertensis]MDH8678467.1 16S rRNA (cytidine(1402)-2'-O)-methyltransferase [Fusibacter bizertensis]